MKWVSKYQLFLFDFDGLLVDTEKLHYDAYRKLLKRKGLELSWDFDRYCQEAHGGGGLEECKPMSIWEGLQIDFPALFEKETKDALYAEKKEIYVELLKAAPLVLMEGAEELLQLLSGLNIKRVVVTNSPRAHIEMVKDKIPTLRTISHWITREDYASAKPSPEGYLKAIESFGAPGDRVIGFEDSVKGLKALLSAGVESVLVCPSHHPHVQQCTDLGVKHFSSLSILDMD